MVLKIQVIFNRKFILKFYFCDVLFTVNCITQQLSIQYSSLSFRLRPTLFYCVPSFSLGILLYHYTLNYILYNIYIKRFKKHLNKIYILYHISLLILCNNDWNMLGIYKYFYYRVSFFLLTRYHFVIKV